MNRADVAPGPDRATDPRDRFVLRPPSQGWEPITDPDRPQTAAWAWFKPPAVPSGLILRLPTEAYETQTPGAGWTMRQLLLSADIEPACVIMWRVNGVAFPAAGGTNPLLDLPVPAPAAGADPNIVVAVALPALHAAFAPGSVMPNGGAPIGASPIPMAPIGAVPMPMAAMAPMGGAQIPMAPMGGAQNPMAPATAAPLPGGAQPAFDRRHEPIIPMPPHLAEAYEHVEQDWRTSQETEKDLGRLRQQLMDAMGRLKALNRDLTGPERVHSNTQEKKDWLQARRMLRDCSNRLWKCIKAHDIGYTSSAGQRRWFEEIFDKYIAPRRHFEGFQEADRAFGGYRKAVTTLHLDMSNALSIAQLDGERRALQVLAKIAEKVREAGNRKNFLGVIMDS
jgi:hypothetical protein